MREVGFVTSWLSSRGGGVPEVVRPLAAAISARGHVAVSVFGLADARWEADRTRWGSVEVTACEMAGPAAFGYAPGLAGRIGRAGLDLLHTHGLWMYSSVVTLGWARRSGKPYLVSPHGMLDGWALRRSRLKKAAAGWLYEDAHLRGAACLHATSTNEAAAIRGCDLGRPVCVIPVGVDLPGEAETPRAPGWLENVPVGAKVLLYLGRLHPKKGLVNLLKTWRDVRGVPGAREWQLVIAGWDDGGHEAELRALARDLGFKDGVVFVGPQFGGDKAASLHRADAFILPSFSEGLPMAVLEAWASHLPVIMTPQCNLPEGFATGAAVSVEPHPPGIGRGLVEIFGMSDEERRTMGRRGRKLVADRFTWTEAARQMQEVYQWVLGGGSPPACIT